VCEGGDEGSPEDAGVRHFHECIVRLGTFLSPKTLHDIVLRYKEQVSCTTTEKYCRCFLVRRPQSVYKECHFWGPKRVKEVLWISGLIAFSIYCVLYDELLGFLMHDSTL